MKTNYVTNYREASIELVDKKDNLMDAWRISRPHFDPNTFEREGLEKLDLPLTSFITYTFDITSSLLFRDLLCTLRPISIWAKSNRSVPITPENYSILSEYKNFNPKWHQDQMNEVYTLVEEGKPQDYAKLKLPLSGETTYALSIDDRTLMNFINVLRLHSKDLYEVYGKKFLKAIGKEENYVTDRVMVDIYDKLAISENEYAECGKGMARIGDFVHEVHKVRGNLMAQYLRSHYSTVKNELFNLINNYNLSDKELNELTCESHLVVGIYCHEDNYKKIVQNRSCYFAHFDKEDDNSWSYVIGDYVEKMTPQEFLNSLTCKGKCEGCTLYSDMLPKVNAGKVVESNGKKFSGEVNFVCPIFIARPDRVKIRKDIYNSDSRIFKKWEECYNAGLLPDNPDYELRKEFESNVMNYGHLGVKPNANIEPIYRSMSKDDYIALMNKLNIDLEDSLKWWD